MTSELEKAANDVQKQEQEDATGIAVEDSVPVPSEPVVRKEARFFPESMSEQIGELAGALAKAQGAMQNGAKDASGYGYKYMELPTLIDIMRGPLAENGIAIIQSHELIKGNTPSVVTHTTVMHSSGQYHKSSLELPMKIMSQLSPAQMVGVNCTYGRRYALQAIGLVAADEDTDASPKGKKK